MINYKLEAMLIVLDMIDTLCIIYIALRFCSLLHRLDFVAR
jgi:hypothetical protein